MSRLTKRQAIILAAVIEQYIETAQPVSSKGIVQHYHLDVSPATVRNEMAALEDSGYLRQPHTSSGRVPTEDGYRFYLGHMRPRKKPSHTPAQLKQAAQQQLAPKQLSREVAKCLVRMTGETAITSLDSQWNYYTGISNLFEKPEFCDVDTLRSFSAIIDGFDEIMRGMFDDVNEDVNIWIGKESPFGKQIATIVTSYRLPNNMHGIIGLVGPTRMDYKRNIKLLSQARELLNHDEDL